jgi:hypothetical protein
MKTNHLILALLVLVCLCVAAPAVQACDGNGGCGWDLGYGYMYNSLEYNVPYFAAHPPVYYSYPVPRTYGFSPFAYPPNVMTPEVVGAMQPLEIVNPYVPSTQQKAADKPADQTTATKRQPEPLVILNPFVTGQKAMAQVER